VLAEVDDAALLVRQPLPQQPRVPQHHLGDLPERGPGGDTGPGAVERRDQVGEEPRPPQAAPADDDPVAARPPHHPHRVVRRPDVAVAQHRDPGGHGLPQPRDRVPVRLPAVVLRGGAAVQRDGGDALLHRDTPGVEVRQVVVVDALARLHRHRQPARAARARHGGAQDGAQQRAFVRQGRAAAPPRHLRHRAAEVEVDVVGEVLLGDHARRAADRGRVHAVELDGARLLPGLEVDQPHRLGVALHQRPGGDHLAHEQPAPAGELPAQRAEGRVRDPGHGREHHGRVDVERADPQGRGHGLGHGAILPHVLLTSSRPHVLTRAR
jgi:hypothetical protein